MPWLDAALNFCRWCESGVCGQGYSVVEFFEAIQRKVEEEQKDRAS